MKKAEFSSFFQYNFPLFSEKKKIYVYKWNEILFFSSTTTTMTCKNSGKLRRIVFHFGSTVCWCLSLPLTHFYTSEGGKNEIFGYLFWTAFHSFIWSFWINFYRYKMALILKCIKREFKLKKRSIDSIKYFLKILWRIIWLKTCDPAFKLHQIAKYLNLKIWDCQE